MALVWSFSVNQNGQMSDPTARINATKSTSVYYTYIYAYVHTH